MEAVVAASQLHAQLGIDLSKPIDVFKAIRARGLWLVFQPLDNLLGATVRQGVGGIVINTERPLSLQRYTAAHELGHWMLHDEEYTWDTNETVLGGRASTRELAAQVFAGSFLMPRQLVVGTLRRLGLARRGRISPQIAYQASTKMGVSYEAALNQFKVMKLLTLAEYQTLKDVRPINIKTELSGGVRPQDPNANVWSPAVEELDALDVALGDEVVIEVPENRTTGYRWTFPASPSAREGTGAGNGHGLAEVEIVADDFQLATSPTLYAGAGSQVGAGGRRRLIFRAKAPGRLAMPLELKRSFQADAPAVEAITVGGHVHPDPARVQARLIAGLPENPPPSMGADD